jgi:hypothetical protein
VVTPMLHAASVRQIPGGFDGGRPDDPIDAGLIRRLAGIEQLAGAAPAVARTTAMRILAERDEGLGRALRLEPPPMTEAAFLDELRGLLGRLAPPANDLPRDAAA